MILCFLILQFTLHCDHSSNVLELNFSGAFLTAAVLTAGLISFRQGNSQLGQKLMRARVVVQGATVALMVGTAYYYGENPWKKS
ncbi:putative hypoxia induced protein [Rosa chinensis]|uniref:Putative hypoxia induced protein n=1 Tax=Rosa chinensis TaxID=74649 RepID=A0A2P6P619_ROSCH|nr:putative hypoxia induced protein [Rosa chinensis]